ncbi:MAG: NAD-dependent DNA ligase LigA [Deltaproteobacteria bacterium]
MNQEKPDNYYYELSQKFIKNEVSNEETESLRELIRFHEWKYYIKNDPVITDFEYDILFRKLQRIEEENPEMITLDSPTLRVSSDQVAGFPSVSHMTPMLSLENSYNETDLKEFDDQIKKLTNQDEDNRIDYSVEPKYDGSTIVLVYENDLFVRAATRGNGVEGDEITQNTRMVMTVPLKAEFSKYGIQKAEIRGEAMIYKKDFNTINESRAKNNEPLFANARNAASGSLRMKDPVEVKKRRITVVSYQISYCTDKNGNDVLKNFKTHSDTIQLLEDLGFKTPLNSSKLCSGIEEVIDFCNSMAEKRENLEYEIDGMVIKLNDIGLQDICGSTLHHPRWALAFKFAAMQAISTLERVEYQVGKFGTITPVAKISPVQLAGVQIQSISLHNEDFILKKDLHLGDKVVVERAGEVIPYIVKAIPELRTGNEIKIAFPQFCPVNTTQTIIPLEKADDEAAWYCSNCICGQVNLQKMIFHVSKDGMDIEGFGESIVRRFWELGWLNDFSDIYNLDYSKILLLDGFKEKSVDNLRKSIQNAKSNPLWKLLQSLSIKNVGKKVSRTLVQQIENIYELGQWDEEKFTHIKDIGSGVAQSVISWFADPNNISILKKMEEYGVNTHQTEEDRPVPTVENAVFRGKTILFTGTLMQMNRKVAQEMAEKAGAQNISAVSKNLNILVVGENAGSKLTKARELGTIEIFTEDEFISRLKEAGLI